MTRTIHLDYGGTVTTELANLPNKMLEGAYDALDQAADLIVGLAQINVRVDTGSLRDSIHKEVGLRDSESVTVSVVAGNAQINYAAIIERKYPYLRPAVELVKPQISHIIESRVMEAVSE